MLRCIGEGSYGEVWLAQNVIGTYRAVKIVYRKNFDDERPFEREFSGIKQFEPISRTHEGMVDILQVGREEEAGYFYYVMEVADDGVSGQDIHPDSYVPKTLSLELSHRGRLSYEECLQQGLSLSAALGHLHKHGLIHRDIKPSNIIFVNGQPKLADIGLVAPMSEARSFVGTEGFIPPEGPGTAQADIYSLGKVLYEISTGKDRQAFPALPTALGEVGPHKELLELNEVVVKACASEVRNRHQTAEELQAELKMLQAGQSVRRLRLLERRLTRLTRLAAVLVVVGVVGTLLFLQVDRNRKKEAELRQRRVGSYVANGTRAVEDGNLLGSLPLFVEALKLDQDDASRAQVHRLRLAAVLNQSPKLSQMWFLKAQVNDVEFTPDGQRLAVLTATQAEVYDLQSGRPVGPAIPYPDAEAIGLSPDGRSVILAGEPTVIEVDIATGKPTLTLVHSNFTYMARFSPDGHRIVTAGSDGAARIWDATNGQILRTLRGHTKGVLCAQYSHNGRYIVTASEDGTAQLWDAATGSRIGPPLQHRSWVYYAAFSPDDQRLVTGGFDKTVRLWAVPSGEPLLWPLNHAAAIRCVEFSPDGRYLACACWDQTVRFWDSFTGQAVMPYLPHSAKPNGVTFSPDGRHLGTCAIDGTVRVWDLAVKARHPALTKAVFSANGPCYGVISNQWIFRFDVLHDRPHPPAIHANYEISEALMSTDGNFIVTLSTQKVASDVIAQLWDANSAKPQGPVFSIGPTVDFAAIDHRAHCLVTVLHSNVTVWATATGQPIGSVLRHSENVAEAVFSSKGDRIATWVSTNLYLWDVATGQHIGPPLTHDGPLHHVVFSPQDNCLVSLCRDNGLVPLSGHLWDCKTFQPIGQPLTHQDGVRSAAFSPDGKRVATGGEDDCVIIWETATGRRLSPALRHFGEIESVAFSHDGRWLVSGSRDHTARVWDVETGEPLTPPLPHADRVLSVQFLAGDRRIATQNTDGSYEIWDLTEETNSPDDLTLLGELLSANTTHFSGGLMPLRKEEIQRCWLALRAKAPAFFHPTPEDIQCWDQRQADLDEAQQQWGAAVFHLRLLLELDPTASTLRQRYQADQVKLVKKAEAGEPR